MAGKVEFVCSAMGRPYLQIIAKHSPQALNILVHDIVCRFGGSISAEHGIGQYRVGESLRTRSGVEIALAQRIKHALDPHGVLNPGKVLPLKP